MSPRVQFCKQLLKVGIVTEKVLQTSSHYCPSHTALEGCKYHSPIIPKALYISPYFLTQPWKVYNCSFLKTDSLNVCTTSVKVALLKPLESAMTFSHSFIQQILIECLLHQVQCVALGYPMVNKTKWYLPHGTHTQALTTPYWICLHNDGHINSFHLPPFQFSIPAPWTFPAASCLPICIISCTLIYHILYPFLSMIEHL